MLRRPRGALRAAELIHLAGSCASTQALTCRIPDVDDELGNPVGVGKRALPTEAFLRHRSAPESGALAECLVQLVGSVLPPAEKGVERLFAYSDAPALPDRSATAGDAEPLVRSPLSLTVSPPFGWSFL